MNPEKREQLPGIAFKSFVQRFVPPTLAEGFQDIHEVNFKARYSLAGRKATLRSSSSAVHLNNERSGVCTGFRNPRPKDSIAEPIHHQE